MPLLGKLEVYSILALGKQKVTKRAGNVSVTLRFAVSLCVTLRLSLFARVTLHVSLFECRSSR